MLTIDLKFAVYWGKVKKAKNEKTYLYKRKVIDTSDWSLVLLWNAFFFQQPKNQTENFYCWKFLLHLWLRKLFGCVMVLFCCIKYYIFVCKSSNSARKTYKYCKPNDSYLWDITWNLISLLSWFLKYFNYTVICFKRFWVSVL